MNELGSIAGIGGIPLCPFLPASPQGLNKGKRNKKSFQTKREALKLGNANGCLMKLILS